jgi:predicted transcriptional regulator
MLGLRMPVATERRLADHARRVRRTKSDVAREAIERFLDAEDARDDLRRQVISVAAYEAANRDPEEAAFDAWMTREALRD